MRDTHLGAARGVALKRLIVAFLAVNLGCSGGLSKARLMNPEECKSCHPEHYRQWSGSMHAYAADDPIFVAMNRRGQRETNGALGDFCIKCHAPVAVRIGATTDGLNVGELPQHLKGVTCYFCHQIDAIEGDHNAAVRIADDGVMRGGIGDPVDNDAHASQYSHLHDRNDVRSAALCGSCHDIVTPKNVALERTFAEWKTTLFSNDIPSERLTCAGCHMPGRNDVAATVEGVKVRRVHDHSMPGVDGALIPWPELEAQRTMIQRELDSTVLSQMCVLTTTTGADIDVTLENVAAGHGWPSGAAQDRRVWIEVVAYRVRDRIFESGVVQDNLPVRGLVDPNLWTLGDTTFDDAGNPAHMFWEVARFESSQLPGQAARDVSDPRWKQTHITRRYAVVGRPDRVTMKVHVRPIGLDVLDDLIESGDLDPAFRDVMPTFTLRTSELEWDSRSLFPCVPVQ